MVPSKTSCKSKIQTCMSGVKAPQKAHKKKESETLCETDGLCSSEHGLRWTMGYQFGGSPIGYAGFISCFKVHGNFLLLCSSNNFVGYSYIYKYIYMFSHMFIIRIIQYIYIYYKYRSIYLKRPAYKQSLAVAVALKKRIACSVPS